MRTAVLLLLCALWAQPALAVPKGFDVGDRVKLYASKAGPYINPR